MLSLSRGVLELIWEEEGSLDALLNEGSCSSGLGRDLIGRSCQLLGAPGARRKGNRAALPDQSLRTGRGLSILKLGVGSVIPASSFPREYERNSLPRPRFRSLGEGFVKLVAEAS